MYEICVVMEKIKARVALAVGILLISIYPVMVRYMGGLAVVSAFYRVLIPAVFLVLFLLVRRGKHCPRGKYLLGSALCGILFSCDIYFWNRAIEGSSATQATLLTNLSPVFVGCISFLFLPQKPKKNFWIGVSVAILGMVIFVGNHAFLHWSFNEAFLLGILSAFFYANYIIFSKMILDKVQVLPYMAVVNFSGAIVLGTLTYLSHMPFTGFSTEHWCLLIIGGVFCQLLAWYFISYSTKRMRATRVSLSLLSQTIFAAILAYGLLDEQITWRMLVGGVIVLLGIGITFIEKPKRD